MPLSPRRNNSFVFFSRSGCLLPLTIILNLFFGWLFLRPLVWLALEGVLVVLFVLHSYILVKRVSKLSSPGIRRSNVIDVEAEVDQEPPTNLRG